MTSNLYNSSPPECGMPKMQRPPEDPPSEPYHDYVESLCNQWMRFRPLNGFMNSKSLREGKPSINVYDLSENGVNVNGVDINSVRINPVGIADIQVLKEFLKNPRPNDKPTRLFVVQDLSPELIELLGHTLSVDPAVFLTHIWTKNWYNKGASQSLVSPSHSGMAGQSFVRFRYVVAREVKGTI